VALAITSSVFQAAGAMPAATAAPGAGLLVAGHVLSSNSNGVAPVDGATVNVWWIPGLQDAQPGEELAIQTVATARTASDGSYTIDLVPTQAMEQAADMNGDWLNFDVGTTRPKPRQG